MRARTDSAVNPMTDVTMTPTRRRINGRPFPASTLSRRTFLAGSAARATLALAGCATGAKQLFSGGSSGTTITVAIVSNSQMTGRDQPVAPVRERAPGHPPVLHFAAGERGPGQDHRGRVHPGRRVRRRDDQQLRDADVVSQRLADEPAAVHQRHPRLRRERLPAPAAGHLVAQGGPVLGAVLRRILVPHVPQGPDGPGGIKMPARPTWRPGHRAGQRITARPRGQPRLGRAQLRLPRV